MPDIRPAKNIKHRKPPAYLIEPLRDRKTEFGRRIRKIAAVIIRRARKLRNPYGEKHGTYGEIEDPYLEFGGTAKTLLEKIALLRKTKSKRKLKLLDIGPANPNSF